jgi:hypothetical protein
VGSLSWARGEVFMSMGCVRVKKRRVGIGRGKG